MAKVKTPLMGLKVHGSIGNALTYQKRDSGTIVRKKPFPTDPQSALQLWHRYLYLEACLYWQTLSAAEKQQWETDARRKRITGFNYFISTELNRLAFLKACYPLDENQGSAAVDFSGNYNHGVIHGGTWSPGKIGNCLYFDGLDDYIDCGSNPSLRITGDLTVEFWFKPVAGLPGGQLFGDGQHDVAGWFLYLHTGGRFRFQTNQLPADQRSQSANNSVVAEVWQHIVLTRSGTDAHFYVNNVNKDDVAASHLDPLPAIQNFAIGKNIFHGFPIKAYIDHAFIYNRVLTADEITMHYERGASS